MGKLEHGLVIEAHHGEHLAAVNGLFERGGIWAWAGGQEDPTEGVRHANDEVLVTDLLVVTQKLVLIRRQSALGGAAAGRRTYRSRAAGQHGEKDRGEGD